VAATEEPIRVGEIFQSVEVPRRRWRVTGQYGENVRLERVDDPNSIRYPVRKALLDRYRYVRDG
jgi:hypothetical protein